jgi:phage baseplate assembly protein W
MANLNTRYSDLDFNFIEHPGLKNILPKTDVEAVKRSVRNLFSLSHGDKPFHPERAIGIKKYLFEPQNAITYAKMRREIIQIIDQFESRVHILDIQFSLINDDGRLEIILEMMIVNVPTPVTISIYLERTR